MKKALSLILSFCLIMTIGIVPAFAANKSDINLLVASAFVCLSFFCREDTSFVSFSFKTS